MATSDAAVCNMALGYVGERQTIDSLDEETEAARACKTYYSEAVLSVLASHWWSFATKRAVLALSTQERDEWAYAYSVPSDCLQPQFLWNGFRNPTRDQLIPFKIELNDTDNGRLLLTDLQEASLVYTRLPSLTTVAPALWPPFFTKAVAWWLASELALVLPVKPEVAERISRQAPVWLARAAAIDQAGQQDDLPQDPDLVRVR